MEFKRKFIVYDGNFIAAIFSEKESAIEHYRYLKKVRRWNQLGVAEAIEVLDE